jgi:SAM-dependent methyltransferase
MALTVKQHLQQMLLFDHFFKIPSIPLTAMTGATPAPYRRINEKLNLPSRKSFSHDDLDPLMALVAWLKPKNVLELGTAHGTTVANICANSDAYVFTVNALPEQISGDAITFALTKEEIGEVYRQNNFTARVEQIYANTLTMDLSTYNLPFMDLIIIDACHDFDFVINDFTKVKPYLRPGGIIVFHDTYPPRPRGHLGQSTWAAMTLRSRGFDIYHIHESWWGIWQRPLGKEKVSVFAILFHRLKPRIPTIDLR